MPNPSPLDMLKVEPNIWRNSEGFFFVDETADFHGPYTTSTRAKEALRRYIHWLEHGNLYE